MGSFAGHIIPGSLFLLVGIWHTICSCVNFAKSPKTFRGRVWHPFPLPGRWKFLELYILMVGTFIDMVPVELVIGTNFRPLVNWHIPLGHLNNYEHASMLLMFFMFSTTIYISEATSLLPLPTGAPHLVAAVAFTGELLLFSAHSTVHHGLEGRYHTLLSFSIAACAVLACLGAAYPPSFLVDVAGGMAVLLQGVWFYQTAFALYGFMRPPHCFMHADTVHCDSEADEMRGAALANLAFVVSVAASLAFGLVVYAIAVRRYGEENIWLIKDESSAGGRIIHGELSDSENVALSSEMQPFSLDEVDEFGLESKPLSHTIHP